MNKIISHLDLDLSSVNDYKIVNAQQLDNDSRRLIINLYHEGKRYDISGVTKIELQGSRGDGKTIKTPITYNENDIIIDFDDTILGAKGACRLKVVLFNNNTILSSFPFIIRVDENVYDENGIIASPVYSELEETLDRVDVLEETVTNNEIIRNNNENTRKKNESARVSNEKERNDAESLRLSAEKKRITEENTRISNEDTRIDSESDRISAENTRKTNESTRKSSETSRVNAENTRKTNETSRTIAENNRNEAETKRATAESERVKSENIRISNENNRKSNELSRTSQETARDTNENSRAKAETVRQTNETTRNDNEEKRSSAESERAISENARIKNEDLRTSSENSRKSAEDLRSKAESQRSSSETERIANEKIRAAAENSRSSEEDIRIDNENVRKESEQARVLSETSRVDAENARVTEFGDIKTKFATISSEAENMNVEAISADDTYKVKVTNKNGISTTSPNLLNKIEIGNVETGEYDQDASASITGKFGEQKLNLKLPIGKPFKIKKSYKSIAEMNDNIVTDLDLFEFCLIDTGSVEDEDTAKLYMRNETGARFLTDLSGAQGIQGVQGETGLTPDIEIGTITTGEPGSDATVVITGTKENPIFNFTIPKGIKGDKGTDGITPTIKAQAGSGIGNVGTPSVTSTKDGDTTTFIFDNLKGESGTNGTNGKSVKSAKQTTTSTSSNGKNVVTFYDDDNTAIGTATFYNGSKGTDGTNGTDGKNGADGTNGIDGKSVTEARQTKSSTASGGENVVTFYDSSKNEVGSATFYNGSKGDKGDPGVNATTTSVATTFANGLMSSTMVSKLNGIASGATAVIDSTVSGWGYKKTDTNTWRPQPDWNATSGDAVIKNKPTLGTAASKNVGDFYSSSQTRTANTVLAAPNGSSGVASFRKLVNADLPTTVGCTVGESGSVTSGKFTYRKYNNGHLVINFVIQLSEDTEIGTQDTKSGMWYAQILYAYKSFPVKFIERPTVTNGIYLPDISMPFVNATVEYGDLEKFARILVWSPCKGTLPKNTTIGITFSGWWG